MNLGVTTPSYQERLQTQDSGVDENWKVLSGEDN